MGECSLGGLKVCDFMSFEAYIAWEPVSTGREQEAQVLANL